MPDVATIPLGRAHGPARSIDDITTLFDLCLVVVDVRSGDLVRAMRPVIGRIDAVLSGSDCTIGVLAVGGDDDEALAALGPLAGQLAVYVDTEGEAARGLGVEGTPALLWVTTEPALAGHAEGWDPPAWNRVMVELARRLAWTRPLMPAPGDPPPFPARPLDPPTPGRAA